MLDADHDAYVAVVKETLQFILIPAFTSDLDAAVQKNIREK
jgi:hypothetical protein